MINIGNYSSVINVEDVVQKLACHMIRNIFKIAEYLRLTIDEVIDKYYGHRTEDRQSLISDDRKRTPCQFLKRDGKKMTCEIISTT